MMHKLECKKYSNKELAEWFGVGYSTYRNKKEKYLEELKIYADYHLEGEKTKKIVIDEVYVEEYEPEMTTYEKVQSKVDLVWSDDGLDSCARVGDEIYELLVDEDENFKIKPSTVYNYTIK